MRTKTELINDKICEQPFAKASTQKIYICVNIAVAPRSAAYFPNNALVM